MSGLIEFLGQTVIVLILLLGCSILSAILVALYVGVSEGFRGRKR